MLGKVVDASHVVVGQIVKRDTSLFLTVKIVDVKRKTIIASQVEKIANMDAFFDTMPKFCKQLIAKTSNSSWLSKIATTISTPATHPSAKTPPSTEQIPVTTTTSTIEEKGYKIGDKGHGGGIVFYVDKKVLK